VKGFEGGQMPLHRRLPKRGFTNIFAKEFNEVGLDRIQAAIDAGQLDAKKAVNAAALKAAGVIRKAKDGIRLLANGELKAAVTFEIEGASKAAQAAVEKAGGSVKIVGAKAAADGEQAKA
jgi:large subunit ribosomal protein L15